MKRLLILLLLILWTGCQRYSPCQASQDGLQVMVSSYLSLYLLSDDIHKAAKHAMVIRDMRDTCGECDGVVERMESVK